MSLHNFNPNNKSWAMYTHTLSSISGDDLTIKPNAGKNLILEVSGNNNVFFKKGGVSHDLTNLSGGLISIASGLDASFSNLDINGNLKEKDLHRQREIIKSANVKQFWRYNQYQNRFVCVYNSSDVPY